MRDKQREQKAAEGREEMFVRDRGGGRQWRETEETEGRQEKLANYNKRQLWNKRRKTDRVEEEKKLRLVKDRQRPREWIQAERVDKRLERLVRQRMYWREDIQEVSEMW